MKRLGVIVLLGLLRVATAGDLPSRVDNSRSDYFPPVVRQQYESCAQQVGIYYMMTYALNLARGTSAQLVENQYAPRFAWNFLNLGKNRGAELVEGWQVTQAMGAPNLADADLKLNEWLHGYPSYLKAMQQRVRSYRFFQITSLEGLQQAKAWLHDRNEANQPGGLLAIEGRLKHARIVTIPDGQPGAGKTLAIHWGRKQGPGHVMTYVGYDDAVGFDLNSDGIVSNDRDITGDGKVTLADHERGAFIAINSFGTQWGHQGKCYVLYRESAVTPFRRGQWAATIDVWPVYHPQLTLKITFATSNRAGMHVSVGAANASMLHTPLIFAHGKAALRRPEMLPESPEKYSGYLLGSCRHGKQPARVDRHGRSVAIEMGFDLTGRVPLEADAYQLLVETASPGHAVMVESASVCRYLPNGNALEERPFVNLPAVVGSRALKVETK